MGLIISPKTAVKGGKKSPKNRPIYRENTILEDLS